MCVVSPKTLIRDNELPKFNGKRIESIYAVYENSRYATKEEGGGYIADILYYNCYVVERDYKDWNGKSTGPAILKIKNLPPEYDGMFGMVKNKSTKVFVTNHYFRMRDSANGSFVDQTLDMGGWSQNSTTGSLSLYRGVEYLQKPENNYVIDEDGELHNKWKKILGHSFQVEEIEFADCGYKMKEGSLDFATKYPYKHTPIRFIDGLVYPDEKLSSWRWLFGMPYRQPDGAENRKSLRIWDDKLNVHLYVELVNDEVSVGEELIRINFSYERHEIYGSKGNVYCSVRRFNESCNWVYAKYVVTKIYKTEKDPVECNVHRGETVIEKKLRGNHSDFYRICRIVNSDHKES